MCLENVQRKPNHKVERAISELPSRYPYPLDSSFLSLFVVLYMYMCVYVCDEYTEYIYMRRQRRMRL